MSGPMPCEVCRNHGRSSTSIDPSCTHGSTISNITCFEQAIFVLLPRSLNTPRWVITRVLPGTDRGTFVMIVGVLVTWAIYTQGQLLL